MKVIQIRDEDAKALVKSLELERYKMPNRSVMMELRDASDAKVAPGWVQANEEQLSAIVGSLHRHFHFHVVRWLQEQGANLS